jgi:hypothetical protein
MIAESISQPYAVSLRFCDQSYSACETFAGEIMIKAATAIMLTAAIIAAAI